MSIGITQVTATAQDLVASIVQETLKQKSVLLPLITDYSSFAEAGAKSVSIPKRTQFAAANKSEGAALTAQALTFSTDKIDLNKHKAIFARLERFAGVQANVAVQAEIIKEMAEELASQVDVDIYSEMLLASAAAPDHRIAFAGATLAQGDLLEARRLLNVQNVGMDERYILVNPLHEKELLLIADFVRADQYGANVSALQNGELGRLYGMKVIMSNVVTDLMVIVGHKTAVGYATQIAPAFETAKDLPNVADEYLLHQLYGVKVLDAGKRQVLLGTAA